MYTKDFWDNIYQTHFSDAPWMSHEWAEGGIRLLDTYIPPPPPQGRILDYGCGNALISDFFMQKGHQLELAEISEELVSWLHSKHGKDVPIFRVDTPADIPGENRYNFVIAWGLFHHINPNLWSPFLDAFRRLMKKDALLFISGWDDTDTVLKDEQKLGRFTRQRVWFINQIDDFLRWRTNEYDIVESKVIQFWLSAFSQPRMIRIIIVRKK